MYVASVGCIWLRWGIAQLMTKCHDQPPAVVVPSTWVQDGSGKHMKGIRTNEHTISGWWFGTWIWFFHILGIIISTDYFVQRGWNHQPDIYIYINIYICIYLYVGGMLNPFATCFGRNYRLPGFLAHTLREKTMYWKTLGDYSSVNYVFLLNMLHEWHIIYLSICTSIDWQYSAICRSTYPILHMQYTGFTSQNYEMWEFSGHHSISRRGTPGTWRRGSIIFNAKTIYGFPYSFH